MRILRVVPFPPNYVGGLPFYCKNLSIQLAERKNVQTDILTSDLNNPNKTEAFLTENVKVIYKKCFSFLWNKNPLMNIFPFLIKNLKNYDIVHAHGYYFFSTYQCSILKKLRNFPLIIHLHGGIQTSYLPVSSVRENMQLIFKERIFDKTIGRFPINASDVLISVSDKDLEVARGKFNISKKKSFYIPNGVDINRFKRDNNAERKYITLIATRLSYIKGVDIYLNIIKELYKKNKNLKFLIIGNGYLEDIVLKAAKELPIKLISYYPYDKIQEIYNMSKLLLITSRYEGVPNTIYESLSCETPVISSNVGGISKVIIPSENGFLFDIKDYRSIIDTILSLVEDDQKIKIFGKQGRNLMEKSYSWDVITEKIYNIYKNLINK